MTNQHMIKKYAICMLIAMTMITPMFGCAKNAATGRMQFNQLSIQQEIALGTQAMPELVVEYGGEVPDQKLTQYVTRIGNALSQNTETNNPDLPWEFTLLDSEVINAFALPGGKVFLSLGLMQEMTNEAQLAGVLGHEIGHVTAQHIDERVSQSMIAAGLGSILASGSGKSESAWASVVPLIVGVGSEGFLLKFSRDQEAEADRLGMRYMVLSNYDPIGQLQVMEILNAAQQESGGSAAPEWLSTHPYPETRIANITEWLSKDFAGSQNNPEFSLHEDRFNRIARPRLDALAKRSTSFNLYDDAVVLSIPATWCAHCRD